MKFPEPDEPIGLGIQLVLITAIWIVTFEIWLLLRALGRE